MGTSVLYFARYHAPAHQVQKNNIRRKVHHAKVAPSDKKNKKKQQQHLESVDASLERVQEKLFSNATSLGVFSVSLSVDVGKNENEK